MPVVEVDCREHGTVRVPSSHVWLLLSGSESDGWDGSLFSYDCPSGDHRVTRVANAKQVELLRGHVQVGDGPAPLRPGDIGVLDRFCQQLTDVAGINGDVLQVGGGRFECAACGRAYPSHREASGCDHARRT